MAEKKGFIHIFIQWLFAHVSPTKIFIPFSISNHTIPVMRGYRGVSDVFIFGIRVASIQRTKPWSHLERR